MTFHCFIFEISDVLIMYQTMKSARTLLISGNIIRVRLQMRNEILFASEIKKKSSLRISVHIESTVVNLKWNLKYFTKEMLERNIQDVSLLIQHLNILLAPSECSFDLRWIRQYTHNESDSSQSKFRTFSGLQKVFANSNKISITVKK